MPACCMLLVPEAGEHDAIDRHQQRSTPRSSSRYQGDLPFEPEHVCILRYVQLCFADLLQLGQMLRKLTPILPGSQIRRPIYVHAIYKPHLLWRPPYQGRSQGRAGVEGGNPGGVIGCPVSIATRRAAATPSSEQEIMLKKTHALRPSWLCIPLHLTPGLPHRGHRSGVRTGGWRRGIPVRCISGPTGQRNRSNR